MKQWTKAEVKTLISLWKKGLTTKVIAEKMKRPFASITQKVYSLQRAGTIEPRRTMKKKPVMTKTSKARLKKAFKQTPDAPIKSAFKQGRKSGTLAPDTKINAYKLGQSQHAIVETIEELKKFLLDKNNQYGDSALQPIRIFSKADKSEQLKVRIDDKLNRLMQGNANLEPDDDVIKDLIGYLVLLLIQMREA